MKTKIVNSLAILCLLSSCIQNADDVYEIDAPTELAQHVGDSLVSIDESGGTTNGQISYTNPVGFEKSFVRLAGGQPMKFSDLFVSQSYATTCSDKVFEACANSQRVRNFAGCTIAGGGAINGNVTLTYTGATATSCTAPASGNTISRIPNFSIVGLRGATFVVSAPTTGQTMTRQSNLTSFLLSNAGINRNFTTSRGTVVVDSTITATNLYVSGNSRLNRTVSGGSMSIEDHVSNSSCALTIATPLIWGNDKCNCPTSGVINGTCTDVPTMSITFGSTCGEVALDKGTLQIVTLDRCILQP